jgi:hypothetical protein
MRTAVRARRDLVEQRVAAANQLRAHLQLVFPGAASLFAAIDTATSLSFLERFTTQIQPDWLSPKRLSTWLSSFGYSDHTDPAVLHARLLTAPRGTTGIDAQIQIVEQKGVAATTTVHEAALVAVAGSFRYSRSCVQTR